MDKIIGITNAPDDVIAALLSGTPISVLAHGKYVGGHIVIYEDSQQIASGDLIDGQDAGGTGTYAYNLTPIEGYSGYDDAKSYRLVIDGDEINFVKNGILTNLPLDAMYIIADFGRGMSVTQTYPDLSSVSVSQTKTVTTKKYQTKKLDKSLLPDGVESGIEAANTKATDALSAAQDAQDTANQAVSDAATAQFAADTAQTTANTAKSTADTAKSTADTAQSTADACVKKQNPVQFNITLGKTSGLNRFVGAVTNNGAEYGCSVVDGSTASFSVGSQSRNMEIVVKATENPEVIFYPPINLTNQADFEFRRLTSAYNHPLIKGLGGIVLYSSTSGSTKKFKITVDDTGTLSATEVTDA